VAIETSLIPEDALSVLEALPVGIFVENAQGEIIWANNAVTHQLKITTDEIMGLTRAQLPMTKTLKLLKLSQPSYIPERQQDTCLQILSAELSDADTAATVYTVLDITELAAQSRFMPELRQPDSLDPETGLMTRKHIHQKLLAEVSRSRRYENHLSVILFQIPELAAEERKSAFIKSAAEVLKDNLRWVDLVGQWEIDEFLIVLPETAEADAKQLAEKISANFDRLLPATEIRVAVTDWQKGDDAAAMLQRVEPQSADPSAVRITG
jgi:diguanylate cyclase (GGDEF)-like protein